MGREHFHLLIVVTAVTIILLTDLLAFHQDVKHLRNFENLRKENYTNATSFTPTRLYFFMEELKPLCDWLNWAIVTPTYQPTNVTEVLLYFADNLIRLCDFEGSGDEDFFEYCQKSNNFL